MKVLSMILDYQEVNLYLLTKKNEVSFMTLLNLKGSAMTTLFLHKKYNLQKDRTQKFLFLFRSSIFNNKFRIKAYSFFILNYKWKSNTFLSSIRHQGTGEHQS